VETDTQTHTHTQTHKPSTVTLADIWQLSSSVLCNSLLHNC